MSVADLLSRHVPTAAGDPGEGGVLARWAFALGAAVLAVLGVSYAIFGVAWAFWGEDAVSDNFVGALAGFALVGGLVASLAASAMAVVAGVKGQPWAQLLFPLGLLPALLLVVVLVEVFWIE